MLICSARNRLQRSKCEEKCCAATDLAFGPNFSTVTPDDALHGSQTDTGPFELGRVVEPLERPEQLVRVSWVEARPVVANEEDAPAVPGHPPHLAPTVPDLAR